MTTEKKQLFSSFFNEQLNQAQQFAVTHTRGPLLVVAGAGSGKTRVITARITNLCLNEEVNPPSIVALTFTNKAATEMKERITSFLDPRAPMPFIGTFHSYCLQLLKKNAHLIRHHTFSILDSDDQTKLISRLISRFGLGKKISTKQVLYSISKKKNNFLTHEDEYSSNSIEPLMRDLYVAYEHEKNLSKCFDFDDLLLEVLTLFRTNKGFKESFNQQVRHVLVDEYQDTNVVQHELLKYMTLDEKKQFSIDSLCVVGDEDQSIYSWRGATVANIMNFKNDFPNCTSTTIDQNYRSAQPILTVANTVITHNQNRNPKKLWSEKKGVDRVRILSCLSAYQEADAVATFLQTISRKEKLSSVALLYRAHYQSRSLEEALIKSSVAYRIIGGIQFYERAEIKDLLAYLRLIVNPFDRISLIRVINTPSRGLGEKFEELFIDRWNLEPFLTFTEVCQKLIAEKVLTKVKEEAVNDFVKIFDTLTAQSKPTAAIERIIQKTDYLMHLKTSHDAQEAQAKIENIKELSSAITHFEEQGRSTIALFLDEVALMQEKTTKQKVDQDQVQLMTLHGAKGLEFDTIIITGVEEGLLPSSHAMLNDDTLEEERRLLYVGITRARERLLITHSKYRNTYGQTETQRPSRFLKEIPESLALWQDCSNFHSAQLSNFFSEWLKLKAHVPQSGVVTFGSSSKSVTPKNIKPSSTEENSAWKKNQPIKHATFGIGIIQKVEEKDAKTIYVTVQFNAGLKKIDSKFLEGV